jgi:GNAT superfamily N-acetyltransferase
MSWRIFQRLFNTPPHRHATAVTDKVGRKFWIYWDLEGFEYAAELHLRYRGRWVGIMSLLREKDGRITLQDIMLLPRDKLRESGLGKAMIRELIRWARANDFKTISGTITPHDGSTMEYLTEWYQRQGFTVREGQIVLELEGRTS